MKPPDRQTPAAPGKPSASFAEHRAQPLPAAAAPVPPAANPAAKSDEIAADAPANAPPRPKEIGGPKGPEPTRYGDWERDGRCVDF